LTGYRCYVTDNWFLVIEKATSFSTDDVFGASFKGAFGFSTTAQSYEWPDRK